MGRRGGAGCAPLDPPLLSSIVSCIMYYSTITQKIKDKFVRERRLLLLRNLGSTATGVNKRSKLLTQQVVLYSSCLVYPTRALCYMYDSRILLFHNRLRYFVLLNSVSSKKDCNYIYIHIRYMGQEYCLAQIGIDKFSQPKWSLRNFKTMTLQNSLFDKSEVRN